MSKKQDKAVKRKAKIKARKVHTEQEKLMVANRVANAIVELCAASMPEYIDDSQEPDLLGRRILWQIGMVAWNVAVSGRKEVGEAAIREMHLDAEAQRMVQKEISDLVRLKYEKYPNLRTSITNIRIVLSLGVPQLKVVLGETFPELPMPFLEDASPELTSEELLAKRKELGLSQVKFAAALGIPVKKISAWEHGKAIPTQEELAKIQETFGAK